MNTRESGPAAVCLFGGTFDPVHTGHLSLASIARQRLNLDRVVFVPCRRSPHKRAQIPAPARHRLQMIRLALAGTSWAEVSTFELDRPRLSRSWETAEHFAHSLPPESRLFWLLGADQWSVLDSWARPDHLARLLEFIVFPRAGFTIEPNPTFRHVVLDVRVAGSSTAVRDRVAAGRPIDDLVPETVARYIEDHRLYQPSARPA